jgi:VWFA-related protein
VNLVAGIAVTAAAGTILAFQTQEPFTIKTNSDLVILDVSVKEAGQHFVPNLSKDNFQVFDDGRPQKISYFSKTDTPAAVGLVLDNSGSMARKRNDVILAGLSFASTSNPQDEYFVVNFNDRVEYGLPRNLLFTDSIEQLHRALNWGRPIGQTRLYDAIASALRHMTGARLKYDILIVVSDGGDNASRIGLPELLQEVERSRATIYTVGLMDQADRDLNPAVMKKLAKVSGGEYFQPAVLNDVVSVFKYISNDVRHRYVLGFVPDEVDDSRKIRTVKVRAFENGHRLFARTRSSYVLGSANESIAATPSKGVL